MSNIFEYCSELKEIPDLSKWDTSKVTYMNKMFAECKSLSSLPDLSIWNISNVKDMSYMFYHCNLKSIIQKIISKWDTSNVDNREKIYTTSPDFSYNPYYQMLLSSFSDNPNYQILLSSLGSYPNNQNPLLQNGFNPLVNQNFSFPFGFSYFNSK